MYDKSANSANIIIQYQHLLSYSTEYSYADDTKS